MQAFHLDTISSKGIKRNFMFYNQRSILEFFLDQICPFSSNNFTDRLVSPIQTGQWLCCHATYHDSQSVILSRSLFATQLLVCPLLYSFVSMCMSLNHRDRTVSTRNWLGSEQPSNPILVQDLAPRSGFSSFLLKPLWKSGFSSPLKCFLHTPPVTGCRLQHVHDEVVHLVEHHKVNG